MNNLSYNINLNGLCDELSLGSINKEPQQIFGGLLHLMFKIITDKGSYAVKALNPQIMQRETAMKNYIFSEKVARIALDNGINAIPAIKSNENSIHELDGQYYLVFPWFEGKPLPQSTVDINKCRIIGELLAKIHNIDFSSIININTKTNNFTASAVDWEMYFEKAKLLNLIWSCYSSKNLETLYKIEKRANSAFINLSKNLVVSHRDLDPKNVLWDENDIPMIIDWEAAGTVNPTSELFEVALYWSGENETPDKKAFSTVINTYIKNGGVIKDNPEDILYSIFKGKLDWLEYNMKRSLRIECSSDEEQGLGTEEVVKTIKSIQNYSGLIPVLLEWFQV